MQKLLHFQLCVLLPLHLLTLLKEYMTERNWARILTPGGADPPVPSTYYSCVPRCLSTDSEPKKAESNILACDVSSMNSSCAHSFSLWEKVCSKLYIVFGEAHSWLKTKTGALEYFSGLMQQPNGQLCVPIGYSSDVLKKLFSQWSLAQKGHVQPHSEIIHIYSINFVWKLTAIILKGLQ